MAATYDVAAVLRAEGLEVLEDPGWVRRSNGGTFAPSGFMVHHTAIGPGASDGNVRNLLVNGRSDLRGPLCQFHLRRDGVVRLIARGSANHAGKGNQAVLNAVRKDQAPKGSAASLGLSDTCRYGNTVFWGVECDNDGRGEGWSRVQMEALERLATAICRAEGWTGNRVIAHREWTARKPDPHGVDMPGLRVVVNHLLRGAAPAAAREAAGTPTWEEAAVGRMPTLGRGAGKAAENGWVRRIQGLLVAWGEKVTVDGQFGPGTEAAVRRFQERAGIAADGIVGRGTWTKLLGL